ncbi:MAG: hypothetical protein RIQ93_2030 [Verrucomicrobiota bacterium]|jgi:lysophospholipase L1-like esterase
MRMKPVSAINILRGVAPSGALLIFTAAAAAAEVVWHSVPAVLVEGKAWAETGHAFDRLPKTAQSAVPPTTWSSAQDSAGLRLRFVSDAVDLRARWRPRQPSQPASPQKEATSASGLDLYVWDADRWQFLGAGPHSVAGHESPLVAGLKPGPQREFLLHLPLNHGIESIELGLPAGSTLEPAPDRYRGRRPLAFYGGSIVQGASASRPGIAYPALLGRTLNWPTLNLGFNTGAKAEPPTAQLLAEIDPLAYVIDCLAELEPPAVAERVAAFVKIVRGKHPHTAILLVEEINYPSTALVDARRTKVVSSNGALRKLFNELKAAGDSRLYYVPAELLLGSDGEDTVDGLHPNDLGFSRIAQGMEPTLREAITASGHVFQEDGFEALFDGKGLSGWKRHDGMPPIHRGAKWWVEDGALLGTQEPAGVGGLLWLDRPFRDFILKLQVQLIYPMDTGVFVRVGPTALSHQITLDYRPGSYVGAVFIPFVGHSFVYRNPEGETLIKEGWNDVEIRMEGEPARIRVILNGRLVTDFQHTAATTKGLPLKGGIALQVHPDVEGLSTWKPGSAVRFRNLRIKELTRP